VRATQTGHTYGTNASVLSASAGLGFNWMELGPTPLAGANSTQGGPPSSSQAKQLGRCVPSRQQRHLFSLTKRRSRRSLHKPMQVATFRRPMEPAASQAAAAGGESASSTQGAAMFAVPALPSGGRIPRRFAATPASSSQGDASSQSNYQFSQSQYRRRKKREASRLRQKEARRYTHPPITHRCVMCLLTVRRHTRLFHTGKASASFASIEWASCRTYR
jgi:hypothetical protein